MLLNISQSSSLAHAHTHSLAHRCQHSHSLMLSLIHTYTPAYKHMLTLTLSHIHSHQRTLGRWRTNKHRWAANKQKKASKQFQFGKEIFIREDFFSRLKIFVACLEHFVANFVPTIFFSQPWWCNEPRIFSPSFEYWARFWALACQE